MKQHLTPSKLGFPMGTRLYDCRKRMTRAILITQPKKRKSEWAEAQGTK
jgi:hypothetical protein